MKIALFQDKTLTLELDCIAENLERLAPHFQFNVGKTAFLVKESELSGPHTYQTLSKPLLNECDAYDYSFLFTEKPYFNNYFWMPYGGKAIMSMYGWDQLTDLSKNNGAVYLIFALLIRNLKVGERHREKSTGCMLDFWRDKTTINVGMRVAFICPSCRESFIEEATLYERNTLNQIENVLNELSISSRLGLDICKYWNSSFKKTTFDVFLCHNSKDKNSVREVNKNLRQRGIYTWFDEEQLRPGTAWQKTLQEQIGQIQTVAVFVGENGLGPWQQIELQSFISQFVERQCYVIPVILKNCTHVPELPEFLKQFSWVDFRKEEPDPLECLIWGITGVKSF